MTGAPRAAPGRLGSVKVCANLRRCAVARGLRPLLFPREAHRLAADGVVLSQRMPFPVVVHEDPPVVGVTLETDAHQVPGLAFVPVCSRPHRDEARHRLAVVDPGLQPHARSTVTHRKQVVVDGEAARLRSRQSLQTLRRRLVEIASRRRADVARDLLCFPAEVIRRGHVGQEVEAELVPQMTRSLAQPRRVDDERRLAVLLADLDQPRDAVEVQDATPRISYAGGTPAMTFSCRRTMPSIRASGRGGQPGTWTSTATILSTPCSVV